jgi:hypothetical protein
MERDDMIGTGEQGPRMRQIGHAKRLRLLDRQTERMGIALGVGVELSEVVVLLEAKRHRVARRGQGENVT